MTQNPLVSAVLLAFPNSKIETIRPQKSSENETESFSYALDSFTETYAGSNEEEENE